MSRYGLMPRVTAFALALVVGTVATLGVAYNWAVFRDAVHDKQAHALIFARAISQNAEPHVLLKDIKGLQRLGHSTAEDPSIQGVLFLDAGFKVLAARSPGWAEGISPDVIRRYQVKPGWSQIQRTADGFNILLPIWPMGQELDLGVFDGGVGVVPDHTPIGFVLMGYTLAPIKHQMVSRAATTGVLALLVVTVAWVLTVVLVKRCLRPVLQLVSTTSAIADGDLNHRAVEDAFGELGQLARSFNHMARRLQESHASIEHQVEERTAQLAQQTRELEKEIAHRQEAEIELRRAKDAAEAASRAKSEFLANMSHELRTPLNGVIGMTDLLLAGELGPKQYHYAQTAKLSADALLSLINDILDLSKVEAGKLEVDQIDFDLVNTIEDVAELMAHKAAEKHLELTCFVDPEIPAQLIGDPARVQQIVVNLANNALKFTEKGEVVITATKGEETEQDIVVRVTVKDTGIGIPTDRLQCLFKPFSQVDASTTRKYGGTGLGLRISKQLAELMGGQIGVCSRPGGGSSFWFTVRLRKPASPTCQARRRLLVPTLKGLHVLVVDDNATNREILCQQLVGWGMRPEAAADAHTALGRLRAGADGRDPFLLAILDMQMPGMDGAELGRAIRDDAALRATPLIMLTSMTDDTSLSRLQEVGFSATVTKPVKQSILLDMILRAMAQCGPVPKDRPHGSNAPLAIPGRADHLLLLVEDNAINQDVAVGILEAAGFRVEVADNGRAALQAVQTRRYDLVLMDCQMPEMDGYEATRHIRMMEQQGPVSAGGAARIPIIALTANALRGDREQCLSEGMDDYVAKPLDPPTLLATIEANLPSQHRLEPGPDGAPASPNVTAAPTITPAPDGDLFDIPSLVERCPGGPALIERILHRFALDAEKLSEQLNLALQQAASAELAQLAHGVKGVAANLSAMRLCREALALENAARAGSLEDCAMLLDRVQAALSCTTAAIPRVLLEVSGPGGCPA